MEFVRIGPGGELALFAMVGKLAAYLGKEAELAATEADIGELLRGPMEAALLLDGETAVGMATWFYMVSTFSGKKILYIEDLFVEESARGQGWGRAFLQYLEQIARDEGCGGLEWKCFAENRRAQAFYRRMGARRVEDWYTYRKALTDKEEQG